MTDWAMVEWSNGRHETRISQLFGHCVFLGLILHEIRHESTSGILVYIDLSGCTLGDQAHNSLDTLMLEGYTDQ